MFCNIFFFFPESKSLRCGRRGRRERGRRRRRNRLLENSGRVAAEAVASITPKKMPKKGDIKKRQTSKAGGRCVCERCWARVAVLNHLTIVLNFYPPRQGNLNLIAGSMPRETGRLGTLPRDLGSKVIIFLAGNIEFIDENTFPGGTSPSDTLREILAENSIFPRQEAFDIINENIP